MNISTRYQILQELGTGGLGEVFQVRDLKDNAIVALKAIRWNGSAHDRGLEALRTEFVTLRSLQHPHLVKVFDLVVNPGEQTAYLTSEFLEGEDFLAATRNQQEPEIVEYTAQICEALGYLHSQGFVHGDIKPSNIIITKQGAKLLDFSLSKKLTEVGEGALAGSLPYLAPEALRGDWQPASDFYSLGVTLSPFLPHVTPRLQRIIRKLLHPDPKGRYASARHLLDDLQGRQKWKLDEALSFYPHVSELIGREREWVQLLASPQQQQRVIVVTGEKGVGKTRLLEAYQTHCLKNGRRCSVGTDWRNIFHLMTLPRWHDLGDTVQILFEAGEVELAAHPALLWIRLGPLSPEAVGRLASRHLARELPQTLIDTLAQISAGNPLRLRETLEQWVYHDPERLKKILNGEPYGDWVPWAVATESTPESSQLHEELGLLYTLFGNYHEALRHYHAAGNQAREALLHHRLGDFSQALALYQTLLDTQPVMCPEQKIQLLSLQAMAWLELGDIPEAEESCTLAMRLTEQVPPLYQVAAYNALGLVQRGKSELHAAAASYQKACEIMKNHDLPEGNLPEVQATLLNNMALVHQERQQFEAAEEAYRQVITLAQGVQDRALELTALQNLGTLAHERGDYGAALRFYTQAKANAELSGETKDNLLFNLATLFIQIGDREEAENCLENLANQQKVGLLRAEIALIWRDWQAFHKSLGEITGERVWVNLLEVQACLDQGQWENAKERLVNHRQELGKPSDELQAAYDLCWARYYSGIDQDLGRAGHLLQGLYRYYRLKRKNDYLWEVCFYWGCWFERQQDLPEARRCFLECVSLLAKMHGALPPHLKDHFYEVPKRQEIKATVENYWTKNAERKFMKNDESERYRKLLDISQQLNTQQKLEPLLSYILDAALELTGAKRGFLISKEGPETLGPEALKSVGELGVMVARQMDRKILENPEFQYSRSLVERVLKSGEPLLVEEADKDTRFVNYQSIHDLGLKSIMICPLHVHGGVRAVVYLDNHAAPRLFSQEDLAVLTALGGQAAMALENFILVTALTKSKSQVEGLNQQLKVELNQQSRELHSTKRHLAQVKQDLAFRYNYDTLVGQSPAMHEVFRLLDRITDTDIPVLIYGESGTGKELIAKALHYNSGRKGQAFVSENCAAIPETLLESELFGHVKGAFTGADQAKEGLFEYAQGGTIFLDEIADLPVALQPKLLRVLQEKTIRPVGGKKSIHVDVRIVSASNKDLMRWVKEGKFREDLYYRLNGIRLDLPPLRERSEDIPLLVDHFLKKFSKDYKKPKIGIHQEALGLLMSYPWPGNIRELENTLRNAFLFSEGELDASSLSFKKELWASEGFVAGGESSYQPLPEKEQIIEALKKNGYNKVKTAKALGWSRRTLYNKLGQYNISTVTGLC